MFIMVYSSGYLYENDDKTLAHWLKGGRVWSNAIALTLNCKQKYRESGIDFSKRLEVERVRSVGKEGKRKRFNPNLKYVHGAWVTIDEYYLSSEIRKFKNKLFQFVIGSGAKRFDESGIPKYVLQTITSIEQDNRIHAHMVVDLPELVDPYDVIAKSDLLWGDSHISYGYGKMVPMDSDEWVGYVLKLLHKQDTIDLANTHLVRHTP